MNTISFVWDKKKSESNLKTHKTSFEEAQTVFSDPNASMLIRIISARKANKNEQKQYGSLLL